MTSPEYQAPTWVNEDDPAFIDGVSPDLGAGYLNALSGAVEDHGQRLGVITPVVTNLQNTALDQATGDNRYILQTVAGTFAQAATTTTELAGKQPLDADLTALAGLDSATAGTVASDGSGWVKKTYAQMKTALGLGNVDNTSDANKPISTATQTALNAKADTNSLGTAVGLIILSASNGTNDSTAINALLSNPGGGPRRVVARPGETYHLGAPLVVPSGTILDFTGATIVLNSGLTSANMVRNTAYTPTATGTGSITSGSPTLTTALASSAVVGQTVTVAGANSSSQVLTARITAVGTGEVTLDTPAGATVTDAVTKLHTRDHDIAIIGGYWKRGSSTSVGNDVGEHTLLFRHVDGLLVTGQRFATTPTGKYCVAAGDVTDFVIEHQHFEQTHSDGVHINGPARNGRIAYLSGTTGDDMVSITAADWTAYNDTQGAVEHLVIEHMQITDGAQRGVQILPGIDAPIRHLEIRDIHGTTTFQPGVQLADDSGSGYPYLSGGLIEDVSIADIRMERNNRTGAPINIAAGNVHGLRIDGVYVDMPTAVAFATPVVDINPPAAASYGLIRVSNLIVGANGQNALVWVRANATVDTLAVEDVHVEDSSLWQCVRVDGRVTDLSIRGLTGRGGNVFAACSLDQTATTARVDRLTVSDVQVVGSTASALVQAYNSTQTLGKVDITGCALSNVYWLADLNTVTTLNVSGCTATGGGGLIHARANANVTLRVSASDIAGPNFVDIVAGGIVRRPDKPRGCRFYAYYLTQSIPSGAPTTVWVATTDFNDDTALFSLASNQVTVAEAGLYTATWGLTLDAGTAGERSSSVAVNGTIRAEAAGYGNTKIGLSGAAPLRLVAGDKVTLSAYVSGGTNVNVVDTAAWKTGLSLIRIGD